MRKTIQIAAIALLSMFFMFLLEMNASSPAYGASGAGVERNTRGGNAAQQHLIEEIIVEKDFFTGFLRHLRRFRIDERCILVSINSNLGNDRNVVGLLFIMPSGLLRTVLIDRDTLTLSQRRGYFIRRGIREEFARHGVPVSEIQSILQ